MKRRAVATYRAELGCGVIRVCKADPFCASPAVRAPLQPSDERTLRRRVRCCTVSGTELDVQRRQIARASRAPSRRAAGLARRSSWASVPSYTLSSCRKPRLMRATVVSTSRKIGGRAGRALPAVTCGDASALALQMVLRKEFALAALAASHRKALPKALVQGLGQR